MLRSWREHRRLSQLALALQAGVSTRHLSFVENGRARPSAELIDTLATHMDVPLRERNALLLAGGFAPRYEETPIDAPALASVRAAIERLLRAHDPYPGVALDRYWNIVVANDAATRMIGLLPPALRGPPVNTFRAGLHPEGLGRLTANFEQWGAYLLRQLDRLVESTLDPAAASLLAEVSEWPRVRALRRSGAPAAAQAAALQGRLLVPFVLDLQGRRLSMFTTLATLGSPLDVTLSELTVELFYPADDESAAALRHASGVHETEPA
ncbi:MAG: helix-turn-helix domain-containing protein [Lautropia sp.]